MLHNKINVDQNLSDTLFKEALGNKAADRVIEIETMTPPASDAYAHEHIGGTISLVFRAYMWQQLKDTGRGNGGDIMNDINWAFRGGYFGNNPVP